MKNVRKMMKHTFLEAFKRTESLDSEVMFFEHQEGNTNENNEKRLAVLN